MGVIRRPARSAFTSDDLAGLGEVACHPVASADLLERRLGHPAHLPVPAHMAAGVEPASRRGVERAGDVALEQDPQPAPLLFGIGHRHRGEQGVGATWGGLTAEEMEDFLAGNAVARLATLKPDGSPYVMPVWYQWDGQDVEGCGLGPALLGAGQRRPDLRGGPQHLRPFDPGADTLHTDDARS